MQQNNNSENVRLISSLIITAVFLFTWQYFFGTQDKTVKESSEIQIESGTESIKIEIEEEEKLNYEDIIEKTKNNRILFEDEVISGSINSKGARIDDLKLKKYKNDNKDGEVLLLSPEKEGEVVIIGWTSENKEFMKNNLPSGSTNWHKKGNKLFYENKKGQSFEITTKIKKDYILEVEQKITNKSKKEIEIIPYTTIKKTSSDIPEKKRNYQGIVSYTENEFHEFPYKKLLKKSFIFAEQQYSWIGITDEYWLVVAQQEKPFKTMFATTKIENKIPSLKAVAQEKSTTLKPNESSTTKTKIFLGPKDIGLLQKYSKEENLKLLSHSIDLGYLYFLVKPTLFGLKIINDFIGNYGISIIILTIIIKFLLYPLSKKSSVSMKKMKELSPEIKEIKEKHKANKREGDLKILELYKREGINPMSGITPLIIQIPFFFALYRTLSVSIDLRQAVFIKGFIEDLSQPDPTSFINLFGLLPFKAPEIGIFGIGLLPILMGLTMWIQQKSTSSTMSEDQTKIMKYIPLIFTFIFSKFASGLLIYWIMSNIFTIIQQAIVNKEK